MDARALAVICPGVDAAVTTELPLSSFVAVWLGVADVFCVCADAVEARFDGEAGERAADKPRFCALRDALFLAFFWEPPLFKVVQMF